MTINQPAESSVPKKKVLIETWGCQMNVADSENMLNMLQKENYEVTDKAEDADLVLLNTCHIREKATHKVLSRLGRLREISKDNNPNMKIAVAGCVAQAEGKKLMAKADNIDILLGPGKIDDLPELLGQQEQSGKKVMSVGFRPKAQGTAKSELKYSQTTEAKPTISGKSDISRYINIAQGCNNFCTFCVVPFTRGREISRHIDEIVTETKNLVQEGAKEVTLLGQNVNSYGLDLVEQSKLEPSAAGPFVDLLAAVAEVPGLERLRFTTSNPHDFSKPIADLFGAQPKLGRYIHLPVQSGNDEVLERMKRKVTVAEYWERVHWLRSIDPEMAISTDLIVGFPGETDEQFEDTLKLVEELRYSFIFAFKYSPRKGTAAARFLDQVPEEVKSERLARLNDLQNRITIELNEQEIGRKRKVLCHYESKKEPGIFYGRTEQFRLVRIPSGRNLVGQMVHVEIIGANKTALVGKLV
ncbi:tRNA (N6-isopentenyl adenosine(37)-C2)-methylthiotransferase MiaB [Pseudobacteriovorax antillogorgiicola]|uniref:tRNA-2-methylthio-N(6)-dimethylallyladenosine synthase n=1 Tax=Pseudobacteriovorax antillogorgiicola TaxID=1513793 RepID=A0A1Y6CPB9_9BACT|nr:tRNA (N6-isopentenyl adenosine(37)-C2)-methylthiotransferase MiaB [Pseudobacteriovorax antillogorgiicola]TCS44399.1 tRNA-i(6)A37 thiotransferase enzyme MiaB [Pseudobacteriovorax antillogorgiicola]SMF79267.1 tRNA-i(6)A37 thiotransferase enzyme MiaB [Pseudobacteriovorax antillogorgiicola]